MPAPDVAGWITWCASSAINGWRGAHTISPSAWKRAGSVDDEGSVATKKGGLHTPPAAAPQSSNFSPIARSQQAHCI